MRKIFVGLGLGAISLALFVPVSFAQLAQQSSVPDLLSAVTALQQVEVARQSILNEVSLQLEQISNEVANLPVLPVGVNNETAARAAELSAITAKLGNLSTVVATLNQLEATETSLSMQIQSQMQNLGIQ
ncbi:MAG: hypothetical protein KGJ13_02720 [Patescibacteria group bacterium]|nr:hypothetical protein [Patescibacteria group bacterium]